MLCHVGLGVFEHGGGQVLSSHWQRRFHKDLTPSDDVGPIDPSFDRKEVARAATNALRSIEFDDHAEADQSML